MVADLAGADVLRLVEASVARRGSDLFSRILFGARITITIAVVALGLAIALPVLVGDAIVAGTAYGRVRALVNPKGDTVESAGPADPVEIQGLASVPSAGDEFRVYADERDARNLAEERSLKLRTIAQEKRTHVTLDDLFARISEGALKEVNLVVKADVQGSIEALKDALDTIWGVEARPGHAWEVFLRKYLSALLLLLGTGFLLLVSLVVSAALSALANYFGGDSPNRALCTAGR